MLLLLPSVAYAQGDSLLAKFYKSTEESCVEFEYKYSVRISGVNQVGSGVLVAQERIWKLVGNGLEMYFDGASQWIIDPAMKEVVIEPVPEDTDDQIQTNPTYLFMRMQNLFSVRESRDTDDGLAVLYVLAPKIKSDISYFNVELLKADASVRNGVVALNDGTLIKIEVSSMKLTPKRLVEDFRPQSFYDSSWMITDLR
jgi:hypothetical protein